MYPRFNTISGDKKTQNFLENIRNVVLQSLLFPFFLFSLFFALV